MYSNFLVRDVEGWFRTPEHSLRFTHASAREFVVREIFGMPSVGSQETPASSVMRANHRRIAKLYVEVMQRYDHPFWDELPDPEKRWTYFELYELLHCKRAAETPSIFDEVWSDVIQRVLLPPQSAIARDAPPSVLFHDHNISHTCTFRRRKGKPTHQLLFSHALVGLNMIHIDDFSDLQLRNLKTAPLDISSPQGILRRFAEHAVMKNIEKKKTHCILRAQYKMQLSRK
ncbi:hypothetical protein GJ744_010491 [Endocarpon pusillum]|uniref:Uncharacterized protein n=1 Tax=Endocarpon pusillum TaxID=364733 RepID=A0A8H7E2X6_9EURO|nr:hypothetical protein GJ744_010491 [Endocarpon pusillum]